MNATELPLEGVWSEDGDIVWLLFDMYPNIARAKYVAYRGIGLPFGFKEGGSLITDLHARVVYMRPHTYEDDNYHRLDDWWTSCESDHPNAVKMYKIWV